MELRFTQKDGADQPPQRSEPRSAILVAVGWSQDPLLISRLFPAVSLAQHVQSSSRTRKDPGAVRFIRQR